MSMKAVTGAAFTALSLWLPIGAQANDASLGKEIYQDTCAACHGRNMVSPGLAFDLRKFPANDFNRFQNAVLEGKPPGMPAWRQQLNADDVKALWDYVKTGG
jgi:mono/diheme cytochrome c family protein